MPQLCSVAVLEATNSDLELLAFLNMNQWECGLQNVNNQSDMSQWLSNDLDSHPLL